MVCFRGDGPVDFPFFGLAGGQGEFRGRAHGDPFDQLFAVCGLENQHKIFAGPN